MFTEIQYLLGIAEEYQKAKTWKGRQQSTRTDLLSGSARHGVYLPLGLRGPVERQIALVLLELERDWGWGRGILGSGAVWNICMIKIKGGGKKKKRNK